MDDVLKDVGLKVADSLPGALAFTAAALVVIVWLAYKVYDAKDLEAPARSLALAALTGAGLAVLIGLPSSYVSARDQCKSEYAAASKTYPAELGGISYKTSNSVTYKYSRCAKVWPNGP